MLPVRLTFLLFTVCRIVDGWIILGRISRRWDVGIWTGLCWCRIGTVGGSLWVRYRTFGFREMRGISWLAANQLASQEGLCTVEWVRIFLCTLPLCNTSSLTLSIQLIFSILIKHHISKLSRYFWSTVRSVRFYRKFNLHSSNLDRDNVQSCKWILIRQRSTLVPFSWPVYDDKLTGYFPNNTTISPY